MFWVWGLFTITSLFWARYVFRRYRRLAFICIALDTLQVMLFLYLFLTTDFPANAHAQPFDPRPSVNRHNW